MCLSSIGNGGKQRRAENAKRYADMLHKLRRALKSKLPEMLLDGIILSHYIARHYTVNVVRDKLQRFRSDTLQHPPYSPDLSLCNFHAFGDLKKNVRGRWSHSDEEEQEWVRFWIRQRPMSFYKNGIDRLVSPCGINLLKFLAITFE